MSMPTAWCCHCHVPPKNWVQFGSLHHLPTWVVASWISSQYRPDLWSSPPIVLLPTDSPTRAVDLRSSTRVTVGFSAVSFYEFASFKDCYCEVGQTYLGSFAVGVFPLSEGLKGVLRWVGFYFGVTGAKYKCVRHFWDFICKTLKDFLATLQLFAALFWSFRWCQE